MRRMRRDSATNEHLDHLCTSIHARASSNSSSCHDITDPLHPPHLILPILTVDHRLTHDVGSTRGIGKRTCTLIPLGGGRAETRDHRAET